MQTRAAWSVVWREVTLSAYRQSGFQPQLPMGSLQVQVGKGRDQMMNSWMRERRVRAAGLKVAGLAVTGLNAAVLTAAGACLLLHCGAYDAVEAVEAVEAEEPELGRAEAALTEYREIDDPIVEPSDPGVEKPVASAEPDGKVHPHGPPLPRCGECMAVAATLRVAFDASTRRVQLIAPLGYQPLSLSLLLLEQGAPEDFAAGFGITSTMPLPLSTFVSGVDAVNALYSGPAALPAKTQGALVTGIPAGYGHSVDSFVPITSMVVATPVAPTSPPVRAPIEREERICGRGMRCMLR
jgi:hypothetical protein